MMNINETIVIGDDVTLTDSNQLFGVIYLRLGSISFPAPDWEDFAVVVLSWWVDGIVSLLVGKRRRTELHFMDGPFFLRIEKEGKDLLGINGFRDGREREKIVSCSISMRGFASELATSSAKLIAVCNTRNWSGAEISLLADRTAILKDWLSSN